jgi:hypothetical protein
MTSEPDTRKAIERNRNVKKHDSEHQIAVTEGCFFPVLPEMLGSPRVLVARLQRIADFNRIDRCSTLVSMVCILAQPVTCSQAARDDFGRISTSPASVGIASFHRILVIGV